jgi:hypothetical protein
MSWLKDKLRNWLMRVDDEDCMVPSKRARLNTVSSRTFETRGMGFTIYQAVGGNVMEYSTYDEKKDSHETRLHIIPSDQDLGEGISHIITYEMLRK